MKNSIFPLVCIFALAVSVFPQKKNTETPSQMHANAQILVLGTS